MTRIAVKPAPKPEVAVMTRSAKVLSLLLILEALRQAPVPMRSQKV